MREIQNIIEYIYSLRGKEFVAVKNEFVTARKAIPGNTLVVYTKNGNKETEYEEKDGYFVLTRTDSAGRPILDKYGRVNSWQISKEKFEEKYDTKAPTCKCGIYRPKHVNNTFVQIPEDIVFETAFGVQTIKKGGYLNISDTKDIYGISKEEFMDMYFCA
jgi:hypothetical protein